MEVVLDESGFGMKVYLGGKWFWDESGFGWKFLGWEATVSFQLIPKSSRHTHDLPRIMRQQFDGWKRVYPLTSLPHKYQDSCSRSTKDVANDIAQETLNILVLRLSHAKAADWDKNERHSCVCLGHRPHFITPLASPFDGHHNQPTSPRRHERWVLHAVVRIGAIGQRMSSSKKSQKKRLATRWDIVFTSVGLISRQRSMRFFYVGRQDFYNPEARALVDHPSKESEEHGETRSGEFEEIRSDDIDFRIQASPHSTVQKEGRCSQRNSQETDPPVWNTPESRVVDGRFEQEPTIQSVQRSVEGIDPQHGKHRVLRAVRDHFWSTMPRLLPVLGNGIVHCACGKCLQPPERNRQLNNDRHDVLSIPNDVIEKNPSHGARHGLTERQRICYKAHNMLRKARQKKCNTMLERFQKHSLYRDSLTQIGWVEKNIIFSYDQIAKEDRTYNATRGERSRKKLVETRIERRGCKMEHWIREMTAKKQRKLVTGGTRSVQQLQDAETQQYIHNNKSDEGPNQQVDGHEENSYRLDSSTRWRYYVPATRNSSSSSSWWQPSDSWWAAWNWASLSWSEQCFFSFQMGDFRLQEKHFPSHRREV